ncbi:MAG TPA: response regulator [Syntrophales bacterium]|nr:response regulator [Syntrophales bacterium]
MQKIKVLIVDDHKVTQKLLEQSLQDDIFEKKIAEDGKFALDYYHEWKPDIILLDILLPVISGYSVLKEIRLKDNDKSTAIIVVSSLMEKADIMDCAKLGIQGYIVKPINFKEICRKVIEYFIKAYPERATEAAGLVNLIKDKPAAEEKNDPQGAG